MVYCSVCMNNNRKNKNISYFCYPKDSVRRHKWLKAVSREDLISKLGDDKASEQYRICEEHFEKCFIKFSKNRTRKYLYDHAFPTLNLPTSDKACSSLAQCENVSTQENIQFILSTEIPSSSINRFDEMVDLEDQSPHRIKTDPDICDEYDICESITAQAPLELSADTPRKRKPSQEPLEAKRHKENDLDSVTQDDFLKLCDKFMTKGMSQIIKWQMDAEAGCSGTQYTQGFKYFALNLHYSGPAAYKFLTNTFCLPPLITLKKLVKPLGTKLDERLLYALKTKVDKMGTQEKICSVSVNWMSLKPSLFYDIKNDRIVGFHDINGIKKKEPAKFVIVIMIRGIIHNWKQPIAHSFLSQSKNCPQVNDWIVEIITSLLNIGLDIRVFISDLGSDFLSTTNSHSVIKDKTYFEINGHKIYYMFDVPHLLKCVRNNLKTCNFIFDNKVAKWSHIKDLFKKDEKQPIRLAPKLTDIHINPNNLQKTRVKVATQVLSGTVASAINTYVNLNLIDVAAIDTGDFVNKINNLFDLLNSSTLRSRNKFKRAFRGSNYQIEFLEEMLKFFSNLKLVRIDGQKDVTNLMNFIHGFQVSIKSLLQLHEDLKSEDIRFIFTRRLNQDCLENFFGKVRQAAGNTKKPTCRKFSIAFNKMFISNILKKPQNTNCDQDFDSLLKKPDDYHIFNTPLHSQANDDTNVELAVGTTDYRFDLPEKNGLVYVSTYLYRKCLEHHKCEKIELIVNKSGHMGKEYLINEGSVLTGFLIIPPANFITFVELLERKFREYFDFEINIINLGADMLKSVQECTFDMPCECFPLDYLKKLYARFRIYQLIKRQNQILKKKR